MLPRHILLALTTFYVVLTAIVSMGITDNLDQEILADTTVAKNSAEGQAFNIITYFGSLLTWIPILLLTSVYMWRRGHRSEVYVAGALMLIGAAIMRTFKFITGTLRPQPDHPAYDNVAYPSGHTTAAITMYLGVLWIYTQHLSKTTKIVLRSFGIIFALVIAYTRIALNTHYPTDVIGGVILGVILSALAVQKVQKTRQKNEATIVDGKQPVG